MKKISAIENVFYVTGLSLGLALFTLIALAVSGTSWEPVFSTLASGDVVWYAWVGLQLSVILLVFEFFILWRLVKKAAFAEEERIDLIKMAHDNHEEIKALKREIAALRGITDARQEKTTQTTARAAPLTVKKTKTTRKKTEKKAAQPTKRRTRAPAVAAATAAQEKDKITKKK